MSTTFQTASPSLQKLDPLKRVNYTFGLVLGVEEFLQSDAYFLGKHQFENRQLHGYGTVCGLDVTVQSSPVLEVQVNPGWAINPKGQEIYVPQLMCVKVNDWLSANSQALQAALGSMPSVLNLCVVLCYRECKSDVVPIPSEPCSQSSSTAPSRIADSFELMLCLDGSASPPVSSPPSGPGSLCEFTPPEPGDAAVRAFAVFLSQLEISAGGPYLTLDQLKQLVRELASGAPPFVGSPPAGPPYAIPPSQASEFLRAAFRTWITEVKPFINQAQAAGPCCPPPQKCVLLAEAAVHLTGNWLATSVTVDDSRRPFLIPTRLLQELYLEAPGSAAPLYQTVAAGYFNGLNGKPINAPLNALTAAPAAGGVFVLHFPGYNPGANYIVKGTFADTALATTGVFEFQKFDPTGIFIRILDTSGKALAATNGFMVEISQIGGGS